MPMSTTLVMNQNGFHSQFQHRVATVSTSRSGRQFKIPLSVVAALSFALAFLVIGAGSTIGVHFLTAWWLESLSATVTRNVDTTNWRHGGDTSVSFRPSPFFSLGFRDRDLHYLRRLHHLVSLDLAECSEITSKGLAALHGLDFLTDLNLERLSPYRKQTANHPFVPLTDACLTHLQKQPRLQNLVLAGNRITDLGLTRIATMTRLKTLDLSITEVTDAGLATIGGMKNLEQVNLGGTPVTAKGLAQLREARPDLKVEVVLDPEVEEGLKRLREGVVQ